MCYTTALRTLTTEKVFLNHIQKTSCDHKCLTDRLLLTGIVFELHSLIF